MKSLLFTVYQTAIVLIIIKTLDAIFGTTTSHATFAAAIGFCALWSANSYAAPASTARDPSAFAGASKGQGSDHD